MVNFEILWTDESGRYIPGSYHDSPIWASQSVRYPIIDQLSVLCQNTRRLECLLNEHLTTISQFYILRSKLIPSQAKIGIADTFVGLLVTKHFNIMGRSTVTQACPAIAEHTRDPYFMTKSNAKECARRFLKFVLGKGTKYSYRCLHRNRCCIDKRVDQSVYAGIEQVIAIVNASIDLHDLSFSLTSAEDCARYKLTAVRNRTLFLSLRYEERTFAVYALYNRADPTGTVQTYLSRCLRVRNQKGREHIQPCIYN